MGFLFRSSRTPPISGLPYGLVLMQKDDLKLIRAMIDFKGYLDTIQKFLNAPGGDPGVS